MLRFELLGDFRIEAGGEADTSIRGARLQSLLGYLLLNRHAPQPRRHLAFLLWPDTAESQAYTNLRNLLHLLRQALPDPDRYLMVTATTVQWDAEAPFSLDVADFEEALNEVQELQTAPEKEAALRRGIALYGGELLPKFDEDWIELRRAELRERFRAALTEIILLLTQRRDLAEAINYGRRLLQLDPLSEESFRTLIQLHAANDDRASALRVYHDCARVLERELGVQPSRATQGLASGLLRLPAQAAPGDLLNSVQAAIQTRLVGRVPELRELTLAWERAVRGSTELILVLGEAGIGKTRLADELLQAVSRRSFATASAHAYATTGTLAYGPLIQWLRSAAIRPRLSSLGAPSLAELSRLLPEVLGEHPEIARPEPLSASWQRQRLFDAITRALVAPDEPLLLLLDDMQWCDQETLDFLHFLLAQEPAAQMLLIGTARSETLDPDHPVSIWRGRLAGNQRVTEIELGPLSSAETAALGSFLSSETLTPELARELHAETEGYPLYIVETIRAGRLRRAGAAAGHGDSPLPAAIRSVIMSRFAQLSPNARSLMDTAAVIGREFTAESLAHIGRVSDEAAVELLDELWRRRIVREHGEDAYDFTHEKLRELAYGELSRARRRMLHRRVAEGWRTAGGAADELARGQLAYHYAEAGLADEAVWHFVSAAQAAQRVFANADAISHLSNAVRLWPSVLQPEQLPVDLAQAYEWLGDVEQIIGNPAAARAEFERAIDALGATMPVRRSHLLRKTGKTWELAHEYEKALQAYADAEQTLEANSAAADRAWWQAWLQVQLERMWVFYWLDRPEAADELAGRITTVATRDGTTAQQVSFFLAQSTMLARRDRYAVSDEAVALSRRAFSISVESGDASHVAWAQFVLGFMLLWHGDLDEAERNMEEALSSAERQGDVLHQSRCLTYLTILQRERGDPSRTRSLALRCLKAAETAHATEYTGTAHANLAWVAWRLKNLSQAQEQAEQAIACWQTLPQGDSSVAVGWTARYPLIAVLLARKEISEAARQAEALLDPGQQYPGARLTGALELACAARGRGDLDEVEARLREALRLAREQSLL